MPPRGHGQYVDGKRVGTYGPKKVVKKKKPPIPVPSLTIAYENPPPKPRPTQAVGPEPKKKKGGGHLPTEFEYLPPDQFGERVLGVETEAEKRMSRQRNQWRERRRRDEARAARAAEREEKRKRRAAVRKLDEKARRFIGKEKLQHYIETGEGLDEGFDLIGTAGAVGRAVGGKIKEYGESVLHDPLRPARDIYSIADWWRTQAPEAVLGEYKKGKGYEGGLAEAWDNMSTQEQIDTIVGGKSLANVIQGQGLTPKNIATAIGLAMMAPIPFGKGLPSLSSVLLRAGFSAAEIKVMLQTGKGLKEALAAAKTPVRPIVRAKKALAGAKGTPRHLQPVFPADAAVIASWPAEAARIGADAIAREPHMSVITLRDQVGNLRSIAAYEMQGDTLVIRELASPGKGGGTDMMRELARGAADKDMGIRLIAETPEAATFYAKIGMNPMGKKGYVWSPEEVKAFAEETPPPQLFETPEEAPIPEVFRFTRDEAEELPTVPGIWYHGTTSAAADEIEATGVLRVGERSDPRGAWLTANPVHAAQFGDTIIMVPESMIPAEAERISAFGGMIASPVDIPLSRAVAEGVSEAGAISPVSRAIAEEVHASGLPLPAELETPEQLARAVEDVFALAKEGAEGKDWYKIAAAQVMRVAEHTGRPPKQIAQLFAIFSQAADTVSNATFVFDASRQFEKFDDLFSGRFPVRQSEEATSVLKGGQWEGRKRSSFYANILRHIPGMEEEYAQVIKAMAESRGAPIQHPVTVDRWVVRMFRPGVKKDVPEQYYDTFETLMQRMAQELGWEPEQIQAAAWVSMKSRALKAELAKKGRMTVRHHAGGGDAFTFGVDRQLELEAQGALFKGLETTPQARRLANQVNKKWGGFTVNRDLTPVPETGYSVTYSLTEETYPLHKIKAADIEQFGERYKNLLRDSRNKIGGFSDDANEMGDGTDVSYLSVTRHFPSDSAQSRAAALRFARQQGQETVYEYKTGNGIRTGLSRDEQHEIITNLDPASNRGGPIVPKPPTDDQRAYDALLNRAAKEWNFSRKKVATDKQKADVEQWLNDNAHLHPDDPLVQEWQAMTYNPPVDEPGWMSEAGFLSPGGFKHEPGSVRTIRVGDMDVQFPTARSQFTKNIIERPADWASVKLASEESVAAAAIRRILPTASATARGSKQLGRMRRNLATRRQAAMQNFVHDLPDMGSAEDFAHFYWAQLPKQYRNVEGLQLVRNQLDNEAREITSGQALENIQAQIDAVKAQFAETEDLTLLGEMGDLNALVADLPQRLEDIAVHAAKLDKLIAKPPKYNPKIIAAVKGLSDEHEKIFKEAGLLKDETAENRTGLLSRWLGIEETGEEVYVGHRMGKVRGARGSLLSVVPGLGKPRIPQGARQRNSLVLARSGRMRPSTHVAAEDWQASEVYAGSLIDRDTLWSAGAPFTGRVPKGKSLVNPEGKPIPPNVRAEELTGIEEMTDDEARVLAEGVIKGWLASNPGEVDAMIEAAKKAGNLDQLRVVDDDFVGRYYAQFTPYKGSTSKGVQGAAKAYDAAVDFTAASIVFARVGYIPKNIAQNLIMGVPHQGPFLLVNVPRAAQALLHPDIRHFLHAEVGFGASHAIGEELAFGKKVRGIPGKTAEFVGKVADDPMRFSAFIHEAAAEGIIPKYSAHLSEEDVAALLDLFTNPEMEATLNNIKWRATEAMADFSRLTPTQQRWARRFLIIPGWLWAGSRYPFHFAATHPGRSAAMAYVAAGEPYADELGLPQNRPITDLFDGGLPQFIEGITLPDSFPIFGGKTFRTTSLSPVSTPYEIALALGGQSYDTAASYANPLAKSLWNIANQRVEYPGGSYQAGYQESIKRNLERLLPNFTFVRQETWGVGEAAGRYPEDESRLGRFFRELGVVPIQIRSDDAKDDDEWIKNAEQLLGTIPASARPKVMAARKAEQAYQAEYSAYEKELGTGLTTQERLIALVRAQAKLSGLKVAEGAEQRLLSMSEDEAEDMISEGRERMGLTAYGRIQDALTEARIKARTHTGMENAGQHDG